MVARVVTASERILTAFFESECDHAIDAVVLAGRADSDTDTRLSMRLVLEGTRGVPIRMELADDYETRLLPNRSIRIHQVPANVGVGAVGHRGVGRRAGRGGDTAEVSTACGDEGTVAVVVGSGDVHVTVRVSGRGSVGIHLGSDEVTVRVGQGGVGLVSRCGLFV